MNSALFNGDVEIAHHLAKLECFTQALALTVTDLRKSLSDRSTPAIPTPPIPEKNPDGDIYWAEVDVMMDELMEEMTVEDRYRHPTQQVQGISPDSTSSVSGLGALMQPAEREVIVDLATLLPVSVTAHLGTAPFKRAADEVATSIRSVGIDEELDSYLSNPQPADRASRERRVRRALRPHGITLRKTPSRCASREVYGVGYMLIDDENDIIMGAKTRRYDAALKQVEAFAGL